MEIDFSKVKVIYCDGGVIKTNPSSIGGTYAFRFAVSDEARSKDEAKADLIYEEAGAIPCPAGKFITNNTTEQIAIVKALELLPDNWSGTLYSDSDCAIKRVSSLRRGKGLPGNVYDRTLKALKRLGRIEFKHIHGIKVQRSLNAGFGSWHQYECDRAAKAKGRAYLDKLNEEKGWIKI